MRRTNWLPGCGALLLAACSGSGVGLDSNGRPIGETGGGGGGGGVTSSFNALQNQIFTPICTGCHAGANAPQGLRLTAGDSYAALVNAPSTEVPSLRRVLPGNPAQSYLLQKVSGSAGIVGARMPLGGPALPADAIDAIRQWILDGAQPPVSSLISALGSEADLQLRAVDPLQDGALGLQSPGVVLAAEVELDTTSLTGLAMTLQRAGGDGSFAEGNEVTLEDPRITVRSVNPTVFAVAPRAAWVADRYRLTVFASGAAPVRSLGGATLPGDFSLQFDVFDQGASR